MTLQHIPKLNSCRHPCVQNSSPQVRGSMHKTLRFCPFCCHRKNSKELGIIGEISPRPNTLPWRSGSGLGKHQVKKRWH